MTKKIDPTHYILMYITGYAFFAYQVYCQLLFADYGLSIIIPFSIAFLLMPLIVFYVTKIIKKNYKFPTKLNFAYTILTILYLTLTSIISLNYASVMIHNYYYQQTHSFIIAIVLLIPVFYITLKDSKIYYSLAVVIFAVYLFYKFLYVSNHETLDIYPLYNVLNIKNPLVVIFLSLPIFIEPLILLSNNENFDNSKKLNTKALIIISIIVAILGSYTIIRQAMEFGLLIENVSFPYFESCKFLSIKSNFDNIDYFYLFSITISIFSRLPMLYLLIKDNTKIKIKGILIIFITTLIIFYFLHKKLEFYLSIINPIFIVSTFILVILFILSLFCKREGKLWFLKTQKRK